MSPQKGYEKTTHFLRRWQSCVSWYHGPQIPCEAQHGQKVNEEVYPAPDGCVKTTYNGWKPRGLASRVHGRAKGRVALPSIGYGSRQAQHVVSSGFRKFPVPDRKELELRPTRSDLTVLTCSPVSSKDHKDVVESAATLAVRPPS